MNHTGHCGVSAHTHTAVPMSSADIISAKSYETRASKCVGLAWKINVQLLKSF